MLCVHNNLSKQQVKEHSTATPGVVALGAVLSWGNPCLKPLLPNGPVRTGARRVNTGGRLNEKAEGPSRATITQRARHELCQGHHAKDCERET